LTTKPTRATLAPPHREQGGGRVRGSAIDITIQLVEQPDGTVRVTGRTDGSAWAHVAPATEVAAVCRDAGAFLDAFDEGHSPDADPVAMAELGRLLRRVFIPQPHDPGSSSAAGGGLLLMSESPACLNLPWELLPGGGGQFLVEDGRWTIRRCFRPAAATGDRPPVAGPLRVLFMACAPGSQQQLDYEREEEAVLHIRDQLRGKLLLDILDSGTFEELRAAVGELRPHVVHLSGHGKLIDSVGHFFFEDEEENAAAREKFAKSLAIRQAIGDRAGEAATLHQIGFIAWQRARKDIGIRLVGMCLVIESAIASGGAKETMRNISGMAGELGLDQAGIDAMLREAAEAHERDRGAELVRQAFEGL